MFDEMGIPHYLILNLTRVSKVLQEFLDGDGRHVSAVGRLENSTTAGRSLTQFRKGRGMSTTLMVARQDWKSGRYTKYC